MALPRWGVVRTARWAVGDPERAVRGWLVVVGLVVFFGALVRPLGVAGRFGPPVALLALVTGALATAGGARLRHLATLGWGGGLAALGALVTPGGAPAAAVVAMVGLVLGLDLLPAHVRRYREESLRGYRPAAALTIVAATSGRAVVHSAGLLLLTAAGLAVTGAPALPGVALGTAVVAVVATLTATVAVPAALVLGDRWGRTAPRRATRRAESSRASRLHRALLGRVTDRAPAALVLTAGVLALLAGALTHTASGAPWPWSAGGAVLLVLTAAGAALALRSWVLGPLVVLSQALVVSVTWAVLGGPAPVGRWAPVAAWLVLSALALPRYVRAAGRIRENRRLGMPAGAAAQDGCCRAGFPLAAAAAVLVAAGWLPAAGPMAGMRSAAVVAAVSAVAVELLVGVVALPAWCAWRGTYGDCGQSGSGPAGLLGRITGRRAAPRPDRLLSGRTRPEYPVSGPTAVLSRSSVPRQRA
ncbi:MMPL family transporter [Streptomyces sp. NRRL S-337]|uniref:MMPL family transporter n=1 Tax=Streptomyces sp. NRRL S-337 TaxID=1463900 RepID=UPI0004CBBE13|nr:MMPL family transporter [Streptomyces sp. NRRL S-337]